MEEEKQVSPGIKGWLILVAISVVLSPFVMSIQFYYFYQTSPFVADDFWDFWDFLTNSDREGYNPYLLILIASELFSNIVLLILSIIILYLFCTKHYLFPKTYALFLFLTLLIPLALVLLTKIAIPDTDVVDKEAIRESIRSFIFCMIWIPYVFCSKRVAATFVRGKA